MKRSIRKLVSMLLVTAMCVSLMPAMPALAAYQDTVSPSKYSVYKDLAAMEAANFSGAVITYRAPHTPDNDTEYIRVDFGMRHATAMDGYDYRLGFDPAKVDLVKSDLGDFSVLTATDMSDNPENGLLCFLPSKYPADIKAETALQEDFDKARTYSNALAGYKSPKTTFTMFVVEPSDLAVDVQRGLVGGAAIWNQGCEANFTIMNEFKEVVTTNYPKPFYIYSNYFQVKSGQSVDETTFRLTEGNGIVSMNGASLALEKTQTTTDTVAMLGFPAAVEKTYPVDIFVESEQGTPYLGGGYVTIDGGTTQYKISTSSGKVLDAEGVGEAGIVLTAGDHTYTAHPASGDFVQNLTGKFKVATAAEGASQTVKFTVTPKPADEVKFDIVVKDFQSLGGAAPLAGASVLLDSTTVVTDKEGKATFTKTGSNTAYPYTVTKLGHTNGSGSALVVNQGSISGNEVALDQPTKTIEVEAKNNAETSVVLANANVTFAPLASGKVPPHQNEVLPKTVSVNATSGKAQISLPNGDYQYTITAPGYEPIGPVALYVRENEVKAGGAIADSTLTGSLVSGGTAATGTTIALSSSIYPIAATITNAAKKPDGTTPVTPGTGDGNKITKPVYRATGTVNSESNPATMTVLVELENINALSGTFGLKYDKNLFTLNTTSGVVLNTEIEVAAGLLSDGGAALTNPIFADGYHAFGWEAKAAGFDTTAAAKTIATYTLNIKNPSTFAAQMHDDAISVMPYNKTANADKLTGPGLMDALWRTATTESPLDEGHLDASLATEGGFFQVFAVPTDGRAKQYDARAQFQFNDYGNRGVTFKAQTLATTPTPLDKVTVSVYAGGTTATKDATVLASGITDATGEVVVALHKNVDYAYAAIASAGYLPYPKAGVTKELLHTAASPVIISMTSQNGHPVDMVVAQKDKVEVTSEKMAYNGTPYLFTLGTMPGYSWKAGKLPTPAQLTVTDTKTSTALAVTWNAKTNTYQIDGGLIEGELAGVETLLSAFTIEVATDALPEETGTSGTKSDILVKSGAGGTFAYALSGNNPESVFDPATPTTGLKGDLKETLGVGMNKSATYTFTPDAATTDMVKAKQIYIVDKAFLNGVQLSLTDNQRIKSYSHQFINVPANQTLTVTYAITKLKDDGTIPTDPTDPNFPKPVGDPLVSVILGDYGSATVTGTNPDVTSDVIAAKSRKDYLVKKTNGTLNLALAAAQGVDAPDGVAKNFVIDTVLVNGTVVYKAGTTTTIAMTDPMVVWTDGTVGPGNYGLTTGTVAISAIENKAATTVTVTFKPAKVNATDPEPPSIEAIVEAKIVAGKGTINPVGLNVLTVGATPTYAVTAEDKWAVNKVNVGGSEVTLKGGAITLDPIKAGTTVIEAAFKEVVNKVKITVDLQAKGSQSPNLSKSGATILFSRTNDGEPGTKIVTTAAFPAGSATTEFELANGTYTVVVKKPGYLNHTITDFKIVDGKSDGTIVDGGILYFGQKALATTNPVEIRIGDAARDGEMVWLADVAQVVAGMLTNATDAMKQWANLNEDGTGVGNADSADMTIVKQNLAKYETIETYAELLARV